MGEFLFNKLFKVNYSFNVKMQIIGDTQVLIYQTCLYVTLLSFNLTCFEEVFEEFVEFKG